MGRSLAELGHPNAELPKGIVLEERIGAGGSVVWRGVTPESEAVAVKIAHPDEAERVEKEGKILEELNHPHIVRLKDKGVYTYRRGFIHKKTVPFLVLDLAQATVADLASEQSDKRVPPEKVINIIEQTASGLDVVHRQGIVHRDIKPENLLIDERGTLKVSDFGSASKVATEYRRPPTKIHGTAAYIAPELFSGLAPKPANDIYSLGITAYKLLAGRVPYFYESPKAAEETRSASGTQAFNLVEEYKTSHQEEEPTPFERILGQQMTDVHGALEGVILERALAKEPAKRASALEFAADLRETYEKAHH